MKLMQSKAAKRGGGGGGGIGGYLTGAVIGIVLLVVLFKLYAVLIPEAQTAGDALNASGVPLGSLFLSGGIVFVIIMASLVILVIYAFMPKRHK